MSVLKLSITYCEPFDRESFEGIMDKTGGENCRHGHDRNDKYWFWTIPREYTVLVPDETSGSVRIGITGRNTVKDALLIWLPHWRNSQIEWAVEEYGNPRKPSTMSSSP